MFAQKSKADEFQIEIKVSKKVLNDPAFFRSQLRVKNDKLQKVLIKSKIRTGKTNRTRLSAFSLLDKKNKIRYRLADYKGYATSIGTYPEFVPYKKTETLNKEGKTIHNGPKFDPKVKDYFNDYDMAGYTNFEIPVNFGTTADPSRSVVYFGVTGFKKFTAELFFALPVEYLQLDYELYYKDEKVADIKFL